MSILDKITQGIWLYDTEYHDGKQFAIHAYAGSLVATIANRVKTVGVDDEAIEKGWRFSIEEKQNAKAIAAVPEMLVIIERLANAHIQNEGYRLREDARLLLNQLNEGL